MSAARVLLWVQHLLGTGHLRRALLLAEALAGRGARVLVASGGPPVPWAPARGVELLQLPAVRAADAHFTSLIGADGRAVDEPLWRSRAARLEAALAGFRPDLVLTEHYPFGRGAFAREIGPLVRRAVAAGIPIAASVRDVLVSKAQPAKLEAMLVRAAPFARVLVHGDPALLPFARSFPLAPALGDRLHHTGYLAPPTATAATGPRSEILVSAGGGAVGRRLCATAAEARAHLPDRPWRIVTGPGAAEPDVRALEAAAGPGLRVDRHRPDLRELIAGAALSVSQAGYNTVVETLAAGTRMLLVPFADGAEDEQTRRAEALAARGLARVLPERGLSAGALARAVADALAAPPPDPGAIRLDGARRSADLLLGLIGAGAG
jgi:predicted glycosyltransferase